MIKQTYVEPDVKQEFVEIPEKTQSLDELEDALILSYLSRKCLCCKKHVEIRKMGLGFRVIFHNC